LDEGPSKREVVGVSVAPWVENRNDIVRVGIDCGEVWSLVTVAMTAGRSQVIRIVGVPVLSCLDVLDVESGKRECRLRQRAVFAPMPSAGTHQASSNGIH
jgi:hypothetical protein